MTQISDDPVLKRQHDALFADVLRDPSNLELGLRYAELTTRMGDYEAAIGALERIAFVKPDHPRLQFDLGVLYFRLGSYELARGYFEAEAGEARAEAAGYLVEIERRQRTTQWSFTGQMGLRHQSNANSGPGNVVKVFGLDYPLPRADGRQADWNAFAQGTLRHVYDLENQRGDTFEASLAGYYARQFRLRSLNAGLLEAIAGPRLALAPDVLAGWSVKPYGLIGGVLLGDAPYARSIGGGISLAVPLMTALIEPGYEIRRRRYVNSTNIPTATEQDGTLQSGYVNMSGVLAPGAKWVVRAAANRATARLDKHAYWSRSLDVALAYELASPLANGQTWTLAPFAGMLHSQYDSADPAVHPGVRRKDREWRVGVGLDAPLSAALGVGVSVQFVSNRSSLPNYSSRNLSVTFGPTLRF